MFSELNMHNDYFNSVSFLTHKFRQLQRRQIVFSIDEKVKSKRGTSPKRRNAFKRSLSQQFMNSGRKAFASDIFLRILYYYSDKNPPTVVNATKNMLDLMHVNINQQDPRENVGIVRSRLPYYDDCQIAFLSVRQYTDMRSSGAHVFIESLNAVLQYANLLSRLRDTRPVEDNMREGGADFNEQIPYPMSSLGYKLEMYRRQQRILRNNQVLPFYLELLYNHGRYRQRDPFFIDLLTTVLKYPIRVTVAIPKNTAEIASQRREITEKLSEYKKQYPLFSALYGPIVLSVFYRPTKSTDVKDVDNYIREIVAPCFETTFTPPSRVCAPTKEELASLGTANYCSNLSGHIMGFDILRLPDSGEHTEDDEVCIIGFHMEIHSDVMQRLRDEIQEIIRNV
jgi:hypothetical protein